MSLSVVSVVVPAFNEEQTVGAVIEQITSVMDSLGLAYEIIVVDDGSTDNTRRVATNCKATVLFNDTNRGKGYAMRKAFQQAQGDIIVTIDADGSHSPKEIPELIEPLFKGADVVAGSRFLGNGKNSTSRLNRVGNSIFNMTIMILTRKRVTDSQTGFRAIKSEMLRKLDLTSLGYDIETEITVKSLKNGFRFREKPISCHKRKYAMSKLRVLNDGARILRAILRANTFKNDH